MIRLVAESGSIGVAAEYLGLCSNRSRITPAEMNLFREVLKGGSPEEQVAGLDALAFVRSRPVWRVLIGILHNTAFTIDIREHAAEMLHLQESRETVEACARALDDPNAKIRFWAAYTLGQVGRKGLRAIAAAALKRVLNDQEVAPGWWSVGREAQAGIAAAGDRDGRALLQAEIQRVQRDADASDEDRRWAECYRE